MQLAGHRYPRVGWEYLKLRKLGLAKIKENIDLLPFNPNGCAPITQFKYASVPITDVE